MFGLVCDRLGSPSDLVKSWGGECDGLMQGTSAELGLYIILYMSTRARPLTIALCPVRVCSDGGRLEYI